MCVLDMASSWLGTGYSGSTRHYSRGSAQQDLTRPARQWSCTKWSTDGVTHRKPPTLTTERLINYSTPTLPSSWARWESSKQPFSSFVKAFHWCQFTMSIDCLHTMASALLTRVSHPLYLGNEDMPPLTAFNYDYVMYCFIFSIGLVSWFWNLLICCLKFRFYRLGTPAQLTTTTCLHQRRSFTDLFVCINMTHSICTYSVFWRSLIRCLTFRFFANCHQHPRNAATMKHPC